MKVAKMEGGKQNNNDHWEQHHSKPGASETRW
jgi:hypothetical protein